MFVWNVFCYLVVDLKFCGVECVCDGDGYIVVGKIQCVRGRLCYCLCCDVGKSGVDVFFVGGVVEIVFMVLGFNFVLGGVIWVGGYYVVLVFVQCFGDL